MKARRIRVVVLAAAMAWVCSCKTLISAETGEPDYTADAQTNLVRGNEAAESRNYLEAEKYFEHVKGKYPFLDIAKEAELRLADIDFDRDQYIEARDRYTNFVKLHPTHPKVDYAAYRAALTHYREMPSEFFLLPPSVEKDQVEVRATAAAMGEFVRQFSKSSFAADAQQLVDDCKKRLAEHELYVADFYAHRARWPAVAGRLTTVVEQYAGLGFDERAYLGLHKAYLMQGDSEKANAALRSLVARLPGTPAAARAQKLLDGGQ